MSSLSLAHTSPSWLFLTGVERQLHAFKELAAAFQLMNECGDL